MSLVDVTIYGKTAYAQATTETHKLLVESQFSKVHYSIFSLYHGTAYDKATSPRKIPMALETKK
jgi:hypothetical protein